MYTVSTEQRYKFRALRRWNEYQTDVIQHYSSKSLKTIQDQAIKIQKRHREYQAIEKSQNEAIRYLNEQNKHILKPVYNLKRGILRNIVNYKSDLKRNVIVKWSQKTKEAKIQSKKLLVNF